MHLTRLASIHRLAPDVSLLLNGLSGAVDLVCDDLRTKLLKFGLGEQPGLEEQDRGPLVERGYLFADEGEERAALRDVYSAYQALASSRPLQLVVCPTYSCNLSCSYCFQSADLRSRPEVMSAAQVADFFAAAQQLREGKRERPCQIVLFGGEPLLPQTEGAVAGLLERAGQSDFAVQIVTNGTCLPRFAPLFRDYRGILKGAQITLDGPQHVHDERRKTSTGQGSFAEVMQAVDTCLQVGLEVNLRVNLDAHNAGALEGLADLLVDAGWLGRKGFRCQLAPVTDHLGTNPYPFITREDELVEPVLALWQRRPELRQALDFQLFRVLHHLISVILPAGDGRQTVPRFHYCEADRGDVVAFGPDSLIYSCPESIGSPRHATGVYSPRLRLWPRRLARWKGRNVLALPECQRCNIATFCGGGCGYAAMHRFGSPLHGVCAGAPDVLRAYVRILRQQSERGELTGLPSRSPLSRIPSRGSGPQASGA